MSADQQAKKVRVKILRQVGPHQPGDEVELDEALANDLCQPSIQQVGEGTQNLQKAVRVEDFEKLKGDFDVSMLTQVEMDELGLKNVIPSPYDTHSAQVAGEVTKQLEENPVTSDVNQVSGDQAGSPAGAPSNEPPKTVEPLAPPVDNEHKGKAKKK